jgi:hypothetical protein
MSDDASEDISALLVAWNEGNDEALKRLTAFVYRPRKGDTPDDTLPSHRDNTDD